MSDIYQQLLVNLGVIWL